jgi:hypothetical protein
MPLRLMNLDSKCAVYTCLYKLAFSVYSVTETTYYINEALSSTGMYLCTSVLGEFTLRKLRTD